MQHLTRRRASRTRLSPHSAGIVVAALAAMITSVASASDLDAGGDASHTKASAAKDHAEPDAAGAAEGPRIDDSGVASAPVSVEAPNAAASVDALDAGASAQAGEDAGIAEEAGSAATQLDAGSHAVEVRAGQERARLFADEAARLDEARASLRDREAEIEKQDQALDALRDAELATRREHARELARVESGQATEPEVDARISQLSIELASIRADWRAVLDGLARDATRPSALAPTQLPPDVHRDADVRAERAKLAEAREKLAQLERSLAERSVQVSLARAQALRDAHAERYGHRVALLAHASHELAREVFAFGPTGATEVAAELEALSLQGRLRKHELVRVVMRATIKLKTPTIT